MFRTTLLSSTSSGFYRACFYSKDAAMVLGLGFYSWDFVLRGLFTVAEVLAGCEHRL